MKVSHDMLGELCANISAEITQAFGGGAALRLKSGEFIEGMSVAFRSGHGHRCREIISNTGSLRASIHVSHVNLPAP